MDEPLFPNRPPTKTFQYLFTFTSAFSQEIFDDDVKFSTRLSGSIVDKIELATITESGGIVVIGLLKCSTV